MPSESQCAARGKDLNPESGRCVSPERACPQSRRPAGCVKHGETPCARRSGQIFNAATGRCRKRASPSRPAPSPKPRVIRPAPSPKKPLVIRPHVPSASIIPPGLDPAAVPGHRRISRANLISLVARSLVERKTFPAAVLVRAKPDNEPFEVSAGRLGLVTMEAASAEGRIVVSGNVALVIGGLRRMAETPAEISKIKMIDFDAEKRTHGVPVYEPLANTWTFQNNEVNRRTLTVAAAAVTSVTEKYADWIISNSAPSVDIDNLAECQSMPAEYEKASEGMRAIPVAERPRKIDGKWYFGILAKSMPDRVSVGVCRVLRESLPWGRHVWPWRLSVQIKTFEARLSKMWAATRANPDDRLVAQVSWASVGRPSHARALIYPGGGSKTWYMIDGWKTKADTEVDDAWHVLTKALNDRGAALEFIDRPMEQGSEPSCAAMALVRSAHIARDGHPAGTTEPLDECLVVFVYRVMAHFAETK